MNKFVCYVVGVPLNFETEELNDRAKIVKTDTLYLLKLEQRQ